MKILALLACVAGVSVVAAATANVSAQSHAETTVPAHSASMILRIPSMHGTVLRRVALPMQAGPSGTPTAVPPTVEPSPSPTVSPYPDPTTLFTNAATLFQKVTSVHFEDIIAGNQTNVEKLTVDAKGIANCIPAVYATVKGTDQILGTAQQTKINYRFLHKGKAYWKRTLTKGRWKRSSARAVEAFGTASSAGFTLDNPLPCSTTASTGGTRQAAVAKANDTLKDLVNLGPATYHKVKTWHLRATDVYTDDHGVTAESLLEFWISQDHFLPYGYKATFSNPDQNVTLGEEQVLTEFGKRVKMPTVKQGAPAP